MKKAILPLLVFSMYFTGVTNTMEKKETSTDPRTSAREREHQFQSAFFPEDEGSQALLMSAIHGDFDPEARPNDAEDLQLTLLVSRLEHALLTDKTFMPNHTAIADASSSSKNSESPSQSPVAQLKDEAHAMPVFKEGTGAIPNQMVLSCAQIYLQLSREPRNKGAQLGVEELTQAFYTYSQSQDKQWPMDLLRRIARHLVDMEEL